MPTPTKGPRLGGSPAHERLMLANLATALFTHGRITTTKAKAKRLRPLAEKLITKAKKGGLHNRRQVFTVVRDKDVVYRLFDEIGPRYVGRPGGYTRIIKLAPRQGDNAPMALIELVAEAVSAPSARGTEAARSIAKTESVAALAGSAVASDEDEQAKPVAAESGADETPAEASADSAKEAPVESAAEEPAPEAKDETKDDAK